LAFAPRALIGAQTPAGGAAIDPTMASYLALAPSSVASFDQAAPFTFGNAQLQMETLGFALPFDMSDADALRDWMQATYSVALPSTFRNYAMMEDFAAQTGFDIGQVFSGVEFGEPPSVVTMIRGSFDIPQIQAAQVAQGYAQLDIDGRPVFSLAEEADFSPENPIQRWALARLNNSAVLDDGTLVYTPTLDLMRTVLSPGDTLEGNPLVQQAVSALDSPMVTAMVLGPAAFVPGLPLELLQPMTQDQIADFILEMQDQEPAPVVVSAIVGSTPGGPLPSLDDDATPVAPGEPKSVTKFALVYVSAEDAAIAASQIQERLAADSSATLQTPWAEILTSYSAVVSADPATVLVTLEWPGVPRSLELVFNRDLGFITG
jgi:hypothetical protein